MRNDELGTGADVAVGSGAGVGGMERASPGGSGAVTQPPAFLTREGPQTLPCSPCSLLAAFK